MKQVVLYFFTDFAVALIGSVANMLIISISTTIISNQISGQFFYQIS